MKSRFLFVLPALFLPASAQEPATEVTPQQALEVVEEAVEQKAEDAKEKDPATVAQEEEKAKLSLANSLEEERLKADLAEMKSRLERMKLEKELISEELKLQAMKERQGMNAELQTLRQDKEKLELEASIAKAEAEKIVQTLRKERANADETLAQLEYEMKQIEVQDEREAYIAANPEYLENPLREDGTLVISDRRIPLNGPITYRTANYITERLSFFNNKDKEKPIFIVIDDSPGGSVMAGYRILKAMEGSEAPIHVVVKSHAASMAACITTLAEKSYAFPNAIILHHQVSLTLFFARLNLTEQKEMAEETQQWWERLAKPIADKMGVTLDEFIAQMYEKSSSGDWAEFATEAQKLKWVDTIVTDIEETALLKNPDVVDQKEVDSMNGLVESLDEEGKPVMYLPRPNPRDRYFIYNPDGYYKLR